jgi:GNAT superfamily N-acetyltransferase
LLVIIAQKSDKKAILRFYKSQHYSASFLGYDSCYFLKNNEEIIASVIISKIAQHHQHYFLHALVVKQQYQRQGLASQLLQYAQRQHLPLICFSTEKLLPFYLKNSLIKLQSDKIVSNLPEHLHMRYKRYLKKQPQLNVFLKV